MESILLGTASRTPSKPWTTPAPHSSCFRRHLNAMRPNGNLGGAGGGRRRAALPGHEVHHRGERVEVLNREPDNAHWHLESPPFLGRRWWPGACCRQPGHWRGLDARGGRARGCRRSAIPDRIVSLTLTLPFDFDFGLWFLFDGASLFKGDVG